VEGLAAKDSPAYEEAQRMNEQAKASLSRVAKKSVRETLDLAEVIQNVDLSGLKNLSDRLLESVEHASRRIELNLRLPESELRAAVAGDESEYQTVLAIKKSAGETLPAVQAEFDRREAEANKE
jgi:hypothetical protein